MELLTPLNYLISREVSSMSLKENVIEVDKFQNIKCKTDKIEPEFFIALINRNKISLYRLAKGMLKIEMDVEDAIGETVLKAFKNINSLKSLKSFKPWLMRILVNECYAIINKRNKIELEENMEVYNLQYEDKNEKTLIWAIDRLDDEFKAVVILFYYEDMSIKEISNVLTIPEGTVKSRLSRAKTKLKLILNNEGRGDTIG